MAPPRTVIVSGCHSGPNPSPGLGIARSLRQAYRGIRLIARDFSPGATGLHADVFDAGWVCPPWEGADLDVLREQLLGRLEGAWLISGLDLEVRWLAGWYHSRVLGPLAMALDAVAKPTITSAARLPVRVPDWLLMSAGEPEVHAFCRHHDWRVWVKGPAYESRRVATWPELRRAAQEIGQTWGSEQLFVQAHIPGQEVSVAYAAYQGDLLGAVFMDKLAITEQGKAWSGAISRVPTPLESALRDVLHDLHWTGGGELEFVRDLSGELWLFDWNPRFPAWIHGATLAGVNLPARLLERASRELAAAATVQSDRFVRVVLEIPARDELPLEHDLSAEADEPVAGKHPSGMPQLARRLRLSSEEAAEPARPLPSDLIEDLGEVAASSPGTPVRLLLPRTAASRFARATELRDRAGVQIAYSIKTNPDPTLMALARSHGLLAEAISGEEVTWAESNGRSLGQVIYNGPVPFDPKPNSHERLGAVFADSVPAFHGYLHTQPAEVVGVRVRPPGIASRFGVPLDDLVSFQALTRAFREASPRQPLGLSFHVQSSEVGFHRWEGLARHVGHFASVLADLTGRSLALIDLGGGWAPDDLDAAATEVLPGLARWLRAELGSELTILVELGKSLAEPSQAVLTRVVEIRQAGPRRREAILDGGISLVPQVSVFPHRIAVVRGGAVTPLGPGRDVLLGPLCMEGDRLAEGIALPADLDVGDLVAICDAGAYDASMSYDFGRGGVDVHESLDRA